MEKKGTRDSSQVKNYRPVSNLPFLSKLLEKVVQNKLQHHVTSNDAMPKFQSAYRQFHSIETAFINIFNDLLLAADLGQVSALCLLDLTSAFDTVDHRLQHRNSTAGVSEAEHMVNSIERGRQI